MWICGRWWIESMSNVTKSKMLTMNEVHKKINLTQWGSHTLRSILMLYMMVTENLQKLQKIWFGAFLMIFIFHLKINLIVSECHCVKLNFFMNLIHSQSVWYFWHLTLHRVYAVLRDYIESMQSYKKIYSYIQSLWSLNNLRVYAVFHVCIKYKQFHTCMKPHLTPWFPPPDTVICQILKIKKSNILTMNAVHKNFNLTHWGSNITRSILSSHIMVSEIIF